MSFNDRVSYVSRPASGDLTGQLRKFCIFDSAGEVAVNTVAQGAVDGIIAEEVDAQGRVLPVVIANGALTEVTSGEAITAGAKVASDASGDAIAWVDAAGNNAVGTAVTSTSAAGEVVVISFALKDVGAGT